jgi:hypothetical protein
MKRHLRALALAVATLWALAVQAAPLVVGDAWLPVTLADAHDRPFTVGTDLLTVVFTADKASSDLVAETLGPQAAEHLHERQAVVVADIHAMPSLVTRLFALPALRALPFPIGLAREAALTADWPRSKGRITLIRLRAGRIEALQSVAGAAELRQALALPTP